MRTRQASVIFVLITLFIDMLGMGLVIPILPRLVQNLLGGTIGESSFIFGLLVSIYAVMQFFCAPVLGALSDRFGRPHGLVRLSIIRSRLGDTHAERLAKAAGTRRSAGHGHGHNLHN